MRKPSHPGFVLYDGFITPNHIKIQDLAEHLGFSRETLSRLCHGKTPMTANMALNLEEAGIGKATTWLNLQTKYSLWEQKQSRNSTVKPFSIDPLYAS